MRAGYNPNVQPRFRYPRPARPNRPLLIMRLITSFGLLPLLVFGIAATRRRTDHAPIVDLRHGVSSRGHLAPRACAREHAAHRRRGATAVPGRFGAGIPRYSRPGADSLAGVTQDATSIARQILSRPCI